MRSKKTRVCLLLAFCMSIASLVDSALVDSSTTTSLSNDTTSKLSAAYKRIAPVVEFFTSFASNVGDALKTTDYQRARIFRIYTNQVNDVGVRYSIEWDFGYPGAGDLEQPFGYALDSYGRYGYKPMNAGLSPGFIPVFDPISDPLGLQKQPLDLSSKGLVYNIVIGLLSAMPGINENKAKQIWSPIDYFTVVQPENIFLLKVILLVLTAIKHGDNPMLPLQLKDVPVELTLLMYRLAQTPDTTATVAAHNGTPPEKAYMWDPAKIVLVTKPSDFIKRTPDWFRYFVGYVNKVFPKISMDAVDYQEWADTAGKPASQMQKLYTQLRAQKAYGDRLNFLLNNIIDKVDPTAMTQTDLKLYDLAIRFTVSERLKGLEAITVDQSLYPPGEISVSDTPDTSIPQRVTVDPVKLMTLVGQRKALLDTFIKSIFTNYQKKILVNTLLFLQQVPKRFRVELADVQALVDQLIPARAALNAALAAQQDATALTVAEQKIENQIKDYVDAVKAKDGNLELGAPSGTNVNISLLMSMDIKFDQIKKIVTQRFNGDTGYVYDDTPISKSRALLHALAIASRIERDLRYAQMAIKQETTAMQFIDPSGHPVMKTGPEVVRDYEQAEASQKAIEKERDSVVQSVRSTGPTDISPEVAAAQKSVDDGLVLHQQKYQEMCSYLKQYSFNRFLPRPPSVTSGIGVTPSIFDIGGESDLGLNAEISTIGTQSAADLVSAQTAQAAAKATAVTTKETINTFLVREFGMLILRSRNTDASAKSEMAGLFKAMTGQDVGAVLNQAQSPAGQSAAVVTQMQNTLPSPTADPQLYTLADVPPTLTSAQMQALGAQLSADLNTPYQTSVPTKNFQVSTPISMTTATVDMTQPNLFSIGGAMDGSDLSEGQPAVDGPVVIQNPDNSLAIGDPEIFESTTNTSAPAAGTVAPATTDTFEGFGDLSGVYDRNAPPPPAPTF